MNNQTSNEQAIAYFVGLGTGFIVLGAGFLTVLTLGSFLSLAAIFTQSNSQEQNHGN